MGVGGGGGGGGGGGHSGNNLKPSSKFTRMEFPKKKVIFNKCSRGKGRTVVYLFIY